MNTLILFRAGLFSIILLNYWTQKDILKEYPILSICKRCFSSANVYSFAFLGIEIEFRFEKEEASFFDFDECESDCECEKH